MTFRVERLTLKNFRCFDALDLTFDPGLTLLFAENGGGKTALLAALAMSLAFALPGRKKDLALQPERDVRRVRGKPGRWEPAGPCEVSCVASIGERVGVRWTSSVMAATGRRKDRASEVEEGIEAVILNGQDGKEAPRRVEGVVLIDEVDLHLHPRWQRTVLDGLRAAFPALQFVVTTHSPQVLSSVRNVQVRRLRDGRLVERKVHVEGRDSNAILREEMDTDERDVQGREMIEKFYLALDRGNTDEARRLLGGLKEKWGTRDPAVIRAETMLDEEG